MSTWTAHTIRPIDQDEQLLYDHWLELVQSESPSQLVQRFRMLFVDGVGYPDAAVARALDKLAAAKDAEQEFRFLLNRCCHILINRWQARPQYQGYIAELISTFEAAPSRPVTEISRSRPVRRLRDHVSNFLKTEQYTTLRRLAQVMAQEATDGSPQTGWEEPLGTLIRRYPYLYEHCLLTEGSTPEQQQIIHTLRETAQHRYELDLSQYVTYQVRRSQLARTDNLAAAGQLRQIKNPTLLTDGELFGAIKHYVGKSQGAQTYRDVAQCFLTHTSQVRSFQEFKDDFYQYITASIDPAYGNRQFNHQLHLYLRNTLPESNQQRMNDFLLMRTCSRLLNFLVVESPQQLSHFVLVDLLSNIGPTFTTGLLLKIVLICRKVKPYLEKRFSILFSHYEASQRHSVIWLVQAMEHLNVALSTNFSTMDLALINQW